MDMDKPILYIFSGLPGTGKTVLAQRLAQHTGSAYLRIDTLFTGLKDVRGMEGNVRDETYRLSYGTAKDNLLLKISVVADSCNPLERTRREWEQVAADAEAGFFNIETVCSDAAVHRWRIENRTTPVPGMRKITWDIVQAKEYHPWQKPHIVIDTAFHTEQESFNELILKLNTVQ